MIKISKSKLFYASLLVGSLTGCGSMNSDPAPQAQISIEEKASRDIERQKIIEGYETKLANLELKIEDAKKKVANASEEARAEFEEKLAELNTKLASARATLTELKHSASDAAADAWAKVVSSLDSTWDNIHAAGSRFLDWL